MTLLSRVEYVDGRARCTIGDSEAIIVKIVTIQDTVWEVAKANVLNETVILC